jgi:ribose transport system permease protein
MRHIARPTAVGELASRFGVPIAWAAVIGVFSLLRPDTFATAANFQTIFGSQAVLLILTLGLVLTLSVGELDLSIAGVMSVAVVAVGYLNVVHHWAIVPVLLVVLAFGVLAGVVNAFFVVVVGVESIVVTLGMGTLLGGLAVAIHLETVTGISQGLVDAVRTNLLGLPYAFWYALILTVAIWYVFTFTPLGRRMHFVRVGPEVARLSGIRVDVIRFGALVATSVCAAFAGVVQAGILGASSPSVSASYLLPAFSAAFLGSTTIRPGRFNAWGTFVGVYFLVTGITGLELLGLSGWIEDVFYGGSLVLAVALSRIVARSQLRVKVGEGNRP